MGQGWIEWNEGGATRRVPLRAGLTLIGGRDADIDIPGTGEDQLHVWDDPPKVVLLGSGPLPSVGGRQGEELGLAPGDVIAWRGRELRYVVPAAPAATGADPFAEAHVEPIELEPGADPGRRAGQAAAAAAGLALGQPLVPGFGKSDSAAWSRIKAGLLVELGIADPQVARTWQAAIARGEFDVEVSTREILRSSHFPESDPRLVQRAGRLARDLMMAPVQSGARGAGRRLRGAAKGGAAFVAAQFIVVGLYTLLLLAALLLARISWGWSIDAFLDRVRGALP